MEHSFDKSADVKSYRSQKNINREPFDGEDTIANRIIYWDYSMELVEVAKRAAERNVPMEDILEVFYPEVSVEEMEKLIIM